MRTALAGTGTLVRLALRRDRIVLPVWTAIFVLLAVFSASASVDLFPDEASRVKAAEAINNSPALVALYGRVYDVTSLGEVSLIKMKGLYALKPWYTKRLTPIVDAAVAHQVSPDVFTVAGVVAAGAAGVVVALGWWPLAALFLALRLAGANLDGAVARARGVSRLRNSRHAPSGHRRF